MKKLVASVGLALMLAGCGSSTSSSSSTALNPASSSGDFTLTMTFEPSPPKQGNETISISVKDAGSAVKGAIVKAATNMPAMSMSGPALTFQDNGDGTYSAVTNMNYQTKWVLDVKVTAGEKSGSAEFEKDVK
jgi:hypothetical protein